MAEAVGFEPTKRFHVCWFSRPVPSTARPRFPSYRRGAYLAGGRGSTEL